jgi:DNA adenine methylase
MLSKPLVLDKPPLRWAGGKSWLTKFLTTIIPNDYNEYHEPFLGGAACFLKLNIIHQAHLSDKNGELINFYSQIKNDYEGFLRKIQSFENTKENYYVVRDTKFHENLDRAARFYFLNRLCFNGIYRVNSKGDFNVPYGDSLDKKVLPENSELDTLSKKLRTANLHVQDFEDGIDLIKSNDLVFLDPPYTVAHNKNGFIEYNEKIFTWQDQQRLSKFIEKIIQKNAYFILTNAYHRSTIDLYSKLGRTLQVDRMSTIAALTNSRKNISELIVTNCV